MNNKEFFEYAFITGIISNDINKDFIDLLCRCDCYVGDYFLKLKKYAEESRILHLLYDVLITYTDDEANIILSEIYNIMENAQKYFCYDTAKTTLKGIMADAATDIHRGNWKDLINSNRIIINPFSVIVNNKRNLVQKYKGSKEWYTLIIGSSDRDTSLIVCKDNNIKLYDYKNIDPFMELKNLIKKGETFDLVGIGFRRSTKSNSELYERISYCITEM